MAKRTSAPALNVQCDQGRRVVRAQGVREAAVGALPDQATEDAELAHHTGGTEEAEEREDADGESPTLYVKNLGFSTTDKALQEHFDSAVSAAGGYIRSARITRKKGPDGKLLSAGFGFVECSSEAVARAVLKKMQVWVCMILRVWLCKGMLLRGPATGIFNEVVLFNRVFEQILLEVSGINLVDSPVARAVLKKMQV